jgi:protein gp37
MALQYNPKSGGRGIEWCDRTVNPIGGCKHGCRWTMPDGTTAVCYAETLAEAGVAKSAYPNGFAHHYWRPKALKELQQGKDAQLVFADSMSDLFGASVPREQVSRVLAAMWDAPHHTFLTLTKAAPGILRHIHELPPNLLVGLSSPPDQMHGHILPPKQQVAMLRRGLDVLGKVREQSGNLVWLSAEPISWDLADEMSNAPPLDWVVIGAASNGRKNYQPEPTHVRRLLELLDRTSTPVFYKGNLFPLMEAAPFGDPELDRWREDFPATYRDGTPIPAVVRRQE